MKKIFSILIISVLLSLLIPFTVNAIDDIDFETIESDIKKELTDIIDDNVMDTLDEMGLSELDFSEIYNYSFDKITEFFSTSLTEKVRLSFKDFFQLLSVIMLTGVVAALFKDYSEEGYITILSVIIVSLLAVNIINTSVSSVVSALKMSGNFMLGFVPIYTLIISLSGNTATALTYNTFVLTAAEIISSVISNGAVDIIGVFFCLGISFSLNEGVNIGRFINMVNKVVSTVLGLSASIFTGFLSIKNILSVSADSLSVRGIRFLIGSLIPIVGSSISEAYSSLLGSINLIKGSVAVVGILVIIIINIPILLETLAYYISFSILGYIADSLSSPRLGDVLRCFSCGIRILLLLCVFEMFILIISTGIVLSVRGGA